MTRKMQQSVVKQKWLALAVKKKERVIKKAQRKDAQSGTCRNEKCWS